MFLACYGVVSFFRVGDWAWNVWIGLEVCSGNYQGKGVSEILIDNFGKDKYYVFYNVTFTDTCLRIKVGYAMSFDMPVLAFKYKELGFPAYG